LRPLAGLVTMPDNGEVVAQTLVASDCVAADRVIRADSVGEAVAAAGCLGSADGVVLLSPGAPSFPHYRDFEARGEAFRQAVKNYKDRSTA